MRMTALGSSPLARGLRHRGGSTLINRGIIPARAGFTGIVVWGVGVYCGSSPLARGLLVRYSKEELIGRIIPARAGFTRRGYGGGKY